MLKVGQIVKAQGILGEVKIKPLTNNPERFKKLRTVFIDSIQYQIAKVRIYDGFVFIKFLQIDSMDKAQSLVNKFVCVDRVHAVSIEEDEYFIADLIGCDFFVDEKKEGKLTNVFQYGSADVFEVLLTNGKTLLFPFLKKLNLVVDVSNKAIYVKSDKLNDVSIEN